MLFTNEKKKKKGMNIEVQVVVESPKICLGREPALETLTLSKH